MDLGSFILNSSLNSYKSTLVWIRTNSK